MLYFRDRIEVKKKSRDATFGNETNTATLTSRALILKSTRQAVSKLKYSIDGKTLDINMIVFVPSDLNIEEGDRIIVLSSSVAYFNSDKEWEVKSVSNIGGVSKHHKEVLA